MDFLERFREWQTQFKDTPMLFTAAWTVVTIIFIMISSYLVAILAKTIVKVRGGDRDTLERTFSGYLFASPWIVGFFIWVLGPIILSLYWSFTNYDIVSQPIADEFGLMNYTKLLFDDERFRLSLINSLYITLFGVPLQLAAALGMAMLLNQNIRGRNIFRTLYYIPVMLASSASVLFTWRLMLNSNNGVINTLIRPINRTFLQPLIGVYIWVVEMTSSLIFALQKGTWIPVAQKWAEGFPPPDRVPLWLDNHLWAKPAVVLIMMWSAGGMMVIYLAALQGVPRSYYEAAEVDGANKWTQFWKITWPMIASSTFYNLILGIISSFQIFEPAVTLVREGGSNDTLTFAAYYLYRTSFRNSDIGYGAAMSWILLIIVLVITAVQFYLQKRWVYYEAG